jgi:hypothetical protein
MDSLGALARVKIHREVGTRGLFFALLFGEAKSSLKNSFEHKGCPRTALMQDF